MKTLVGYGRPSFNGDNWNPLSAAYLDGRKSVIHQLLQEEPEND